MAEFAAAAAATAGRKLMVRLVLFCVCHLVLARTVRLTPLPPIHLNQCLRRHQRRISPSKQWKLCPNSSLAGTTQNRVEVRYFIIVNRCLNQTIHLTSIFILLLQSTADQYCFPLHMDHQNDIVMRLRKDTNERCVFDGHVRRRRVHSLHLTHYAIQQIEFTVATATAGN